MKDLYFDDHTWTIRYLIVETGGWLSGRRVLISPQSLKNIDVENEVVSVNLTIEQVKNSPDIGTDLPVSRQQEMELNNHYPWIYWGAGARRFMGWWNRYSRNDDGNNDAT